MNPPIDRKSLLASDARRSLDGLAHSLSKGSFGMAQGALHSRDLAVALTQIGLDPVSVMVDDVARHLTMGQPGVLPLAVGIVPLIRKALDDIQLGIEPNVEKLQEDWWPLSGQLPQQPVMDEISHKPFVTLVPPSMPMVAVSGMTDTQSEPAQTAKTDLLALDASDDPGLLALRTKGLHLIQQARIVNQQDDERSVRQMDALLSELQDWSLRLGQRPLAVAFPRFESQIQDVWADPAQIQNLKPIQSLADRATQMTAQSRSLTIFLDWLGLDLTDEEMKDVAQAMSQMRGQVRKVKQGYRLVFPSSLSRMRVMPFLLKGQLYAVAAAQFVQFNPTDSGPEGSGKIVLRAGQISKSLEVDRFLPGENANVSPVPDAIDHPQWLAGVIVSHHGEVCLCVAPV